MIALLNRLFNYIVAHVFGIFMIASYTGICIAFMARKCAACAMSQFSKNFVEIILTGCILYICVTAWRAWTMTWYEGVALAAMISILLQKRHKGWALVVGVGVPVCAELSSVDAKGNTIPGNFMRMLIEHVQDVTKAFEESRSSFNRIFIELYPSLVKFLVAAKHICEKLQTDLIALYTKSNMKSSDQFLTTFCAFALAFVLFIVFYVLIYVWWNIVKWVSVQVLRMSNYEILNKNAKVDPLCTVSPTTRGGGVPPPPRSGILTVGGVDTKQSLRKNMWFGIFSG